MERERRHHKHCCFYCSQADHLISQCPYTRRAVQPVSPNQCLITHAFTMPVIIEHSGTPLVFTALLDSGVAGSFIDEETVHQLGLPTEPLLQHIRILVIDGGPIGGA